MSASGPSSKPSIRKKSVPDARPTQLYRHFDCDGRLLYVGISASAALRLVQHKEYARWFRKIAFITIENFETRAQAAAAERKAISEERPVFNMASSKTYDEDDEDYLTRDEIREIIGASLWRPLRYWEKCRGKNICVPPRSAHAAPSTGARP